MTLEEAKNMLKNYLTEDGKSLKWKTDKCLEYLNYFSESTEATLDGEFTADQLEAISIIMRQRE